MSEENLLPSMPVKVAFIIDNEVVDILHTDERLGAILLSNPLIIDVSDHINDLGQFSLTVGSKYNQEDESFTKPQIAP